MGNGLLLDALGSRRSSIHPDVLLSARIHPGSGAGVVVDKVNPAFRSMSLLPSRWEVAGASCGCARGHHGRSTSGWRSSSSSGGCSITTTASSPPPSSSTAGPPASGSCSNKPGIVGLGLGCGGRRGGGVGPGAVFDGKHAVVVPDTLGIGVLLEGGPLVALAVRGRGTVPGGGPGVVVDVVCAAQVVLPPLPTGWESSLRILKGTHVGSTSAVGGDAGRSLLL